MTDMFLFLTVPAAPAGCRNPRSKDLGRHCREHACRGHPGADECVGSAGPESPLPGGTYFRAAWGSQGM